jgi:hypothetical protein
MPSKPLSDLQERLKDIDEILSARDAICPTGAGRPAQRKGAAVIAGGTVLLSALFEGFVEELFELTVDQLYASTPAGTRNTLKEHTSRKNNNANVHQVNTLFFYLGSSLGHVTHQDPLAEIRQRQSPRPAWQAIQGKKRVGSRQESRSYKAHAKGVA